MWFLDLKFSHYPSRPVPLPELFVTTRPDPVPKSKTTTRQSLIIGRSRVIWGADDPKVLMINMKEQSIEELGSLIVAHSWHSCAIVSGPAPDFNKNYIILATGGLFDNSEVKDELFDLTKRNSRPLDLFMIFWKVWPWHDCPWPCWTWWRSGSTTQGKCRFHFLINWVLLKSLLKDNKISFSLDFEPIFTTKGGTDKAAFWDFFVPNDLKCEFQLCLGFKVLQWSGQHAPTLEKCD